MSTFPPLVRLLSDHHWEAAKQDMKEGDTKIKVGTSYDLEGKEDWQFYIVKRRNRLEKHSVNVKQNFTDISPYDPMAPPPVPVFNATRQGTPRPPRLSNL